MQYSKIFAALIVVILLMVNFNVEYSLAPIDLQVGIEFNTAEAGDDYVADYKMEREICWATGEEFDICRRNPQYLCIVGNQDACSSTEPEVN